MAEDSGENNKKDNPDATYQNTEAYLRAGGPSSVTQSNWGGGEGPTRRVYPDLPFGGYFMSPGQLKEAGVAGFSDWGYHPNVRTNVFGRAPGIQGTISRGRGLDNVWSPQNVKKMNNDTLTAEHQRMLEWTLRQSGKKRG